MPSIDHDDWLSDCFQFLLAGLYLMMAWSWVIVPIFKLPVLNYWGRYGNFDHVDSFVPEKFQYRC